MNKDDRRHLKNAALQYCSTVKSASENFSDIVTVLKSREEEKLENIPDNLQDSPQAENIKASIDQLEELLSYLEEADNSFDSITECTGVIPACIKTVRERKIEDTDPRNNRFQILLSDYLLSLLKLRAMGEGCSCNELVCRSLLNELLKDPSKR